MAFWSALGTWLMRELAAGEPIELGALGITLAGGELFARLEHATG